jgi:hypothetical protein
LPRRSIIAAMHASISSISPSSCRFSRILRPIAAPRAMAVTLRATASASDVPVMPTGVRGRSGSFSRTVTQFGRARANS